MELKNCQAEAKKQILHKINNFSHDSQGSKNQKLWLQAPTGSGKTLIIAHIIEAVWQKAVSTKKNIAVIFFTISQGDLANQASDKFARYEVPFPYKHIASPSRIKNKNSDHPNDLIAYKNYTYLIGISSLRDKAIIKNYFPKFIEDLSTQNEHLLVIWDEAHIGARDTSKFNKTVMPDMKKYFTNDNHKLFTLKSTATVPEKEQCSDDFFVKITTSDARKDNLIKSEEKLIIENNEIYTDEALIKKTLQKFKEVQQKYQKKQLNIRPAVLVQIKAKIKNQPEQWTESLNQFKKIIENDNLTWVVWTSDVKEVSPNLRKPKNFTLNWLAEPTCEVDVILFMYALATGYDIPRACFLLQLKKLSSKTLSTQILGRIKRNPTPDLRCIRGQIYDQYFVYSNLKEDVKITLRRKPQYQDFTIQTVQLNEKALAKEKRRSNKNINDVLTAFFQAKNENSQTVKQYYKEKFGWNLINNDDHWIELQVSYYNDPRTYEKIFNLLHLKKIWDQYAFNNKELRVAVDKWIAQKPLPEIFDWVWYCFFIDQKNQWIVKEIKKQISQKYSKKRQQFLDLCISESKEIKKNITLLTHKRQPQLPIKGLDLLNNFPYEKAKSQNHQSVREQTPQPIKIPLDSNTEWKRLKNWWWELSNLEKKQIITQLTICKNFKTLDITYPIMAKNQDLNSKVKHHPDVWVRFYHRNLEYTLIIEFKSKRHTRERHIDLKAYDEKIKKIKHSYPLLSKIVSEKYYFFILDLSDNINSISITVWFKNKSIYEGNCVRELLQKILKSK